LLKYNLDLKAALRAGISVPRGFQLSLPPGYKDRLLRQASRDRGKKSRPVTTADNDT
jgi:hypothetical protein